MNATSGSGSQPRPPKTGSELMALALKIGASPS
ncbi:hypothetical protein HMPREF9237_01428 [Actinotignum schaalii FB123-CNA-2]|uniref:Uncharacterized protein n=1 Tax=Actinotignum schaalii FB123-CNA-2 TaxID=883067 RepID=S2VFE4_9ACTO|nr:hypothetical protein HMPREF9237_01428 [Actinotignum schaalii FB123-CNA-2]